MEDVIESHNEDTKHTSKWLATGGILGAVTASTCCLLPLVLTLLGVSGAWMGSLRAMALYQPYFLVFAAVVIGYGFYQVYWKPRAACAEGTVCARPIGGNLVKAGLWFGVVLVFLTATFSFWFPYVLPYLP